MRIPYKAKPEFDAQKVAKDLFKDQKKRALVIRNWRFKKAFAYQFIASYSEIRWFRGEAGWPIKHQIYRTIGEAICREAAKLLAEPFEYPWSDE